MKRARRATPPQMGDSTALGLAPSATLPGSLRSRTGRQRVDAGSIPGSFPACSSSVCRIDVVVSSHTTLI
jgi:hypothetical protein